MIAWLRNWWIAGQRRAHLNELAWLESMHGEYPPEALRELAKIELDGLKRLEARQARIERQPVTGKTSLATDAVLAALIVFAVLLIQAEISEHEQVPVVAQR